ncbi:MAG TPA: metalloregulator ArsR/SmtB family transcription factor [Candidatus Paceibacterota bacterium]|nr:metalloregulator ArsR/SmtB family transcription factor [Candidatus Paceibacterota bacterium]
MNEKELERVFKALANKRRIAILKLIKKSGSISVGEVAEGIKLSFKATSKHLLILSNANILEKEQISLSVLYSLQKDNNQIITKLLSII